MSDDIVRKTTWSRCGVHGQLGHGELFYMVAPNATGFYCGYCGQPTKTGDATVTAITLLNGRRGEVLIDEYVQALSRMNDAAGKPASKETTSR